MKELFPEYAFRDRNNHAEVWPDAIFVFDTNVLLNLYRYQSSTRDQLLNILSKLSEKIWIPHHVALEFQRNRLLVIAEQGNRFTEVRKAIQSAKSNLTGDLEKLQLNQRHSLINPEKLTSGLEQLSSDFLEELDRLETSQQSLTGIDPIKDRLEELFDGKVGPAPDSQDALDAIYQEGAVRYELKTPPGYLDVAKGKDEGDRYSSGGLIYTRRFGDYLIWKQMLDFAKSKKQRALVLITDDSKEDWWYQINSGGPKKLGPRPELKDEAKRFGIKNFMMHSPEGFLEIAKDYLKETVSQEMLEEVRDVSIARVRSRENIREFKNYSLMARILVRKWLERLFIRVQDGRKKYFDFIAYEGGSSTGVTVHAVRNVSTVFHKLRELVHRFSYYMSEVPVDSVALVFVIKDQSDVNVVKYAIIDSMQKNTPEELSVVIGIIENLGTDHSQFLPLEIFKLGDTEDGQGVLDLPVGGDGEQ